MSAADLFGGRDNIRLYKKLCFAYMEKTARKQ